MVVGAGIGYVVGAVLAIFHDRLYTGSALRGPIRACADGHGWPHWWAGTAGYLVSRGRCPEGCRLRAPLWYQPLIGAVVGGGVAWRAENFGEGLLLGVFVTILLALVATDFERHLLPNRLVYPAILLAVALCWAWPGRTAAGSLAGGLAAFAVMFLIFMLSPQFGFGDVKLAALLGLVSGLDNTLMALITGSLAGAFVAVVMLTTRRAQARATMPYGPYLALGAFIGMLAGV
jgi:prepilin signal peptidase PulO-like enzyme (type II secretory pathway)